MTDRDVQKTSTMQRFAEDLQGMPHLKGLKANGKGMIYGTLNKKKKPTKK